MSITSNRSEIYTQHVFRYSSKIFLPAFNEQKKYVDSTGKTLNHYHKPIFLMMKHLAMWSPQGSVIIDITLKTKSELCMQ